MAGYNPEKVPIFIDIDASQAYRQWRAEESMTLTRARSKAGGWYVTSLGRRMDTEEMLKLQGLVPNVMRWTKDPELQKICCKTHFNAAIGNAMSGNVLERLLPKVAHATGVIKRCPKDDWESDGFVDRGARFVDQ